MLSSLFDEGHGTGQARVPSLVTRPPHPRPPCNLVGLDNQGSTCYLNSLIQQLFQTPEMLVGLFAIQPEELGVERPEEAQRRIPLELQRLFAQMLAADETAVSTADLTRSFGWTSNETFQQHDVQELNRILFAAIEESLLGLPSKAGSLVRDLYHGTLVSRIECAVCGGLSEREEDYQDLCVPVSGHRDLTSSLIEFYVQTETLEGDNAYKCERCQALVKASKGMKIKSLPPILTISLLRFNFDMERMERYKETGSFEFPMTLDMAPFVANESPDSSSAIYDLVGVVIHRGSTYGGHYHAYIRDVLNIAKWERPEDEPIRVADSSLAAEIDSPQELLTLILQQCGTDGMQIGKLGGEVTKLTGASWNGRFRAKHGPLVKFIKRHDHLWGFNGATQWVWLLDSRPAADEASCSEPVSASSTSESQSEPAPAASQGGWFDFNDAHVTPIHQSAIARQFCGRESAYLLTYRSRALQAAWEASRGILNPPDWLWGELEAQNAEWRSQREEYELRIHAVSLRLLDARHVVLESGALSVRAEPEAPTLRIDCRKSLAELLAVVPDLSNHRALSLLHKGMELALYVKEELLDCEPQRSLSGLGISNGAQLLLWDGTQLDGVQWEHCHELPFKIIADAPGLTPDFSMRVHGIQTPLFVCLLQHWPSLDVASTLVSRVLLADQGTPRLETLSPEDFSKTADQLGWKGEVQLLLGDMNAESEEASADARGLIQQHFRYNAVVQNSLVQEENPPSLIVPFDCNMTVLDFRMETLRACGFNALEEIARECRLRVSCGGEGGSDLGPPLIDDAKMIDCGLDLSLKKVQLVLERGPCVPSGHIFLTVLPWDASGECSLVVRKSSSLADVKASAMSALLNEKTSGPPPGELILQLLTWCDAPSRSFRDEAMSLSDALLSHGDRLLLARGQPVARGHVLIPLLWRRQSSARLLSPAALHWRGEEGGGGGRCLEEAMTELAIGGEEEEARIALGEVNVRLEASVAELKALAVATMREAAVEVRAEELEEGRVRLRAVEDEQCRAVLKSATQTVQRSRLSSCRPLCLELLPVAEFLSPSDLVLALRLRDEASRSYSRPLEFVWSTEAGATASSLYARIADVLATERSFRLAKRTANQHRRWLPIPPEDISSPPTRNVGRQRSAKAREVSLLRAPFGLRDGDVIAFKAVDNAAKQLASEDFDSTEDDLERARKEEEAASRKHRRNAAGSNFFIGSGVTGGGRPAPAPEVPLVIHVQRFDR